MPNINDRIGSQNVIRVLSNASAPPTRLVNLSDVDSSRKTDDGMILVWDLSTEKFFMSDAIDASNLTVTGIVTFSNTTNSSSPTTGALAISGGLGVAKQVNFGNGFSVAGLSTFSSNMDLNASLDVLNRAKINGTFETVGVTTLSSSGGITTTGGDLYVGGDLFVGDDLTFDEFTARNANVTGIATVGTLLRVTGFSNLQSVIVGGISTFVGDAKFNSNVSIAGTLTYEDVTNIDAVGLITARSGINIGHPSVASTMTSGGDLILGKDLSVSGVSTFTGVVDANGGLDVSGGSGLVASTAKVSDLTNDRVVISGTSGELEDDVNLTFNGTQFFVGVNLDVFGRTELETTNIAQSLNVVGVTTLSSSGGITTTGGDLYVGGDLFVGDDLTFDEFTARNANVTGISTVGTLLDVNGNIDVAGVSTFVGVSTFQNNVSVSGTLTAGLIDGGIY